MLMQSFISQIEMNAILNEFIMKIIREFCFDFCT